MMGSTEMLPRYMLDSTKVVSICMDMMEIQTGSQLN